MVAFSTASRAHGRKPRWGGGGRPQRCAPKAETAFVVDVVVGDGTVCAVRDEECVGRVGVFLVGRGVSGDRLGEHCVVFPGGVLSVVLRATRQNAGSRTIIIILMVTLSLSLLSTVG